MTLTITLDRPAHGAHRREGRVRRAFGVTKAAVMHVASSAARPHKASLRRLADMPLSVAGTGIVDFSAFHAAHGWGWLVTGLSLYFIEHLISDDGPESPA